MRKTVKYGIIGFISLVALTSLVPQDDKQQQQQVKALEKQAETLGKTEGSKARPEKTIKKLKKERKVKDLVYDPSLAVQWTVGVLDDGSRRFGYAQYVCEIIRDDDALDSSGETYVRIVDVAKVAAGQSPRSASLGQVRCEDYKIIER